MASNFINGRGRIATDLYDFMDHKDGYSFNHKAADIDLTSSGILGSPTNVEDALINLTNAANTEINQPFISIGDGYDTWHAANGTNNFDGTIPSLDTLLNPIFNAIINKTTLPNKFKRIKNGGVVVIKSGTYIVKSPINVPPGITLMGEGFGTKIINGNNLDFTNTPVRKTLNQTPGPVFIVKRDIDRNLTSDAQNSGIGYFMFLRETKICNMVIADNFVENPLMGNVNWLLPQNISGDSPLIRQENSSSLILDGINFVGKSTGSGNATVATKFAIQLDTNVVTVAQSMLKVRNCFIDNVSQAINWKGINGFKDYLEVENSKIRAVGWTEGFSDNEKYAMITINDNNFKIVNNQLSCLELSCIIYLKNKSSVASTPAKGIISSNNIFGTLSTGIVDSSTSSSWNGIDRNLYLNISEFANSGEFTSTKKVIANDIKVITSGTSYTVLPTDYIIIINTINPGNFFNITLPRSSENEGRMLIIKDISESINLGGAGIRVSQIDANDFIDGVEKIDFGKDFASLTLIATKSFIGWAVI